MLIKTIYKRKSNSLNILNLCLSNSNQLNFFKKTINTTVSFLIYAVFDNYNMSFKLRQYFLHDINFICFLALYFLMLEEEPKAKDKSLEKKKKATVN